MTEVPVFARLADLFSRLDPCWDEHCSAILARLYDALAQGHTCLPLRGVDVDCLQRSSLLGRPGSYTPLLLEEGDYLYFARQWQEECSLAAGLTALAEPLPAAAPETIRHVLDSLFPGPAKAVPDRQKLAVALALRQRFLVISGGPGTGKTTTISRLLALLSVLSPTPLTMVLAAPTGKAAARLSDAMRDAMARLPAGMARALPLEAQTLHRLLGLRPGGYSPQYNRANPLPLDVLVVDEASMIDVALMLKTVEALPSSARLILLGDHDQLASVEAGEVLGALCQRVVYRPQTLSWLADLGFATGGLAVGTGQVSAMTDAIVLLTESHRFAKDSGIGVLSQLVNANQARQAEACLISGQYADLTWLASMDAARLWRGREPYWQAIDAGQSLDAIAQKFVAFMPLVSERKQLPLLNQQIERQLEQQGRKPVGQAWYPGRPVMITRNDYELQLFNGDIGFVIARQEGLRVLFPADAGQWRAIAPGRLPEHETVYAMTVHKSQGSEFDEVWLFLPPQPSALLNRTLVYTAITRARQHFVVVGSLSLFSQAIENAPQRFSGLPARIHMA